MPRHLYEHPPSGPWHLQESHVRQGAVSKPGLAQGSPEGTMLSEGCLVFRQHWAISGSSVSSESASFFPSIISYSSESSLAGWLLCLSSPSPHYFLSCSTIPHSLLIITASITLWPPFVRVAGEWRPGLSHGCNAFFPSLRKRALVSLDWKMVFFQTALQLAPVCLCNSRSPHVEWNGCIHGEEIGDDACR